jgi:hypothetical protein
MYLLDANIFIQAKNEEYTFDICPAFWDWIGRTHNNGRLFSIAKVKDELLIPGDELSDWAKNQPDTFFLPVTTNTPRFLRQLSIWSTRESGRFTDGAIRDFLNSAD